MIELIRTAVAPLWDRRGVTAMEYAVIAAGIVIVVAIAADAAGTAVVATFTNITNWLTAHPGG